SAVRRPVTTESLNPSHVCTLQTLSLTSGPRLVFPPTPDLAVEKGLHGDWLETTTRSTHRTETLSTSRLTGGGPPHAKPLDGASLHVQEYGKTPREYRRKHSQRLEHHTADGHHVSPSQHSQTQREHKQRHSLHLANCANRRTSHLTSRPLTVN
ncbi:hypothetical protein Taro_032117, partial [Colocasia esculenta]|nr:hypothetical protein [Colocasia esculenta]